MLDALRITCDILAALTWTALVVTLATLLYALATDTRQLIKELQNDE